MPAEYDRPKFDSKLENTKHFLAPLINNLKSELARYQALQEKYKQMESGPVVKRVFHKVFGTLSDQSHIIEDLELRIAYYQSMIDRFNEDGSEEMQHFLLRTITTYLARIEAAQRDTNKGAVPWEYIIQSDTVSPRWVLNQGIILLRQLNPDTAATLDEKFATLQMTDAYVGFDPPPQASSTD